MDLKQLVLGKGKAGPVTAVGHSGTPDGGSPLLAGSSADKHMLPRPLCPGPRPADTPLRPLSSALSSGALHNPRTM